MTERQRYGLAPEKGEAARAERGAATSDFLVAASERLRVRDCQAAGVDPTLNITPTLYRKLYGDPKRKKGKANDEQRADYFDDITGYEQLRDGE